MSLASVGARARIPSIGGNQTIDQIEEDLALRPPANKPNGNGGY
jgi:hypothetical protein